MDYPWYTDRTNDDYLLQQSELQRFKNPIAMNLSFLPHMLLYACIAKCLTDLGGFPFELNVLWISLASMFVFLRFWEWSCATPLPALRFFERSPLKWFVPFGEVAYSRALCGAGRLVEAQVLQTRHLGFQMLSVYSTAGYYKNTLEIAATACERTNTSLVGNSTIKYSNAVNLGYALLLTDDCAESIRLSEEVLNWTEGKNTRAARAHRVEALINCARAKIRQGILTEAEAHLCELEQILTPADNCSHGELQLGYCELRLREGRDEEALLYAQIALAEYEAKEAPGTCQVSYAKHLLAYTLFRCGRTSEAESLRLTAHLEEDDLLQVNRNARLRCEKIMGVPQITASPEAIMSV